jgi:prepilin-type N-terminal cleavage/methylation domain-containing protein
MRRLLRRHPGFTVIELLVSLVLLSMLVMLSAQTARVALTTQARTDHLASRASALADARRTLRAHLAGIAPTRNDLHEVRDTVLDLTHTLGSTVVCRVMGDTVVIAARVSGAPWHAAAARLVDRGDMVRVWNERVAAWSDHVVLDARSASGPCGDATRPWPEAASQRLVIADTLPSRVRPGAPIRVMQRQKWSLVRGSDGLWSLSLATWDAALARFATPQPLVSGLAAPSAPEGAGFAVRAEDSVGSTLSTALLTRTRHVSVRLRAARHPRYGSLTDSVLVNVRGY